MNIREHTVDKPRQDQRFRRLEGFQITASLGGDTLGELALRAELGVRFSSLRGRRGRMLCVKKKVYLVVLCLTGGKCLCSLSAPRHVAAVDNATRVWINSRLGWLVFISLHKAQGRLSRGQGVRFFRWGLGATINWVFPEPWALS